MERLKKATYASIGALLVGIAFVAPASAGEITTKITVERVRLVLSLREGVEDEQKIRMRLRRATRCLPKAGDEEEQRSCGIAVSLCAVEKRVIRRHAVMSSRTSALGHHRTFSRLASDVR